MATDDDGDEDDDYDYDDGYDDDVTCLLRLLEESGY
jgi:hypothetical protein